MAEFKKADYEHCEFFVGRHKDEDGNPLIVVDGKPIGSVQAVIDLLSHYKPSIRCNCDVLSARIDVLESDSGATARALMSLEKQLPARVLEITRDAELRKL